MSKYPKLHGPTRSERLARETQDPLMEILESAAVDREVWIAQKVKELGSLDAVQKRYFDDE